MLLEANELPLTEADYEVWGKGLRNPFRLDTDETTGDIYIGDVGDITIEVGKQARKCAKVAPESSKLNGVILARNEQTLFSSHLLSHRSSAPPKRSNNREFISYIGDGADVFYQKWMNTYQLSR